MKANWKLIGIGVAAAAALVYPGIKLYQYIAKRRAEANKAEGEEEQEVKPLRLLKHAKHTPHHRVAHN